MVGASFGAWVAASAAVKSTALISSLVLVAPVGIKVGDRDTRDFVDLYAIPRHEALAAIYGAGPRPDLAALGPEDFLYLAQAQEAMARYGFQPYLHDPALVHRLHRIGVPTLVLWGNDDQFVSGPRGVRRHLRRGHRPERQPPGADRRAPARGAGPDRRGLGRSPPWWGRHRSVHRWRRSRSMRDIRNYVFTEMAYPFTPPDETFESVRVTLPNRLYDPEAGSELYDKYFDIYRAADELGLDIMLNEHHSTATCLDVAVPLSAAIVARETRPGPDPPPRQPRSPTGPTRSGWPRRWPWSTCCPGAGSQCGFVRGVPMEVSPQNVTPIDMYDRFWEAADLIIKAWTTHDGPFNWEGEHFHARQVNIWPRPHQQPHPPIWVPTQSASTGGRLPCGGHNLATILTGTEGAAKIFGAFRKWAVDAGLPEPGPERVGYSGLMFVGENEREARAGGQALQWYLQHNKTAAQFMDVPGYLDPCDPRPDPGQAGPGRGAAVADRPPDQRPGGGADRARHVLRRYSGPGGRTGQDLRPDGRWLRQPADDDARRERCRSTPRSRA